MLSPAGNWAGAVNEYATVAPPSLVSDGAALLPPTPKVAEIVAGLNDSPVGAFALMMNAVEVAVERLPLLAVNV
jgi:hypothetical protein